MSFQGGSVGLLDHNNVDGENKGELHGVDDTQISPAYLVDSGDAQQQQRVRGSDVDAVTVNSTAADIDIHLVDVSGSTTTRSSRTSTLNNLSDSSDDLGDILHPRSPRHITLELDTAQHHINKVSYSCSEEEEEEQFESYGENDDETDSVPSSTAFDNSSQPPDAHPHLPRHGRMHHDNLQEELVNEDQLYPPPPPTHNGNRPGEISGSDTYQHHHHSRLVKQRSGPGSGELTWPRSRRCSNNRSCGVNRRISSNAFASHLYHNVPNIGSGGHSPSSASDDMFAEEIAEDVYDLNSKVYQLQEQVSMLAQTQLSNNDKQIKLKQDNAALTERVHMLEEQVRDGEIRAEKRLDDEQRRAQDLLARMDKEKSLEIEALHYQVRDMKNEYRSYEEERPRLKQHIEKLKQEKSHLQEQLSDCEYRLKHLEDDNHLLEDQCKSLQHELDVTNRTHGELLDELSKELEELKQYKLENESVRSRTPSLLEYPGRVSDLERQIQELKKANTSLKEQHDELQAQMLNYSIQEGRNLLQNSTAGVSLADELNDMSRDDVMQKLQTQQEINKQLKKYIDDMLINIIDNNPGILEIKK